VPIALPAGCLLAHRAGHLGVFRAPVSTFGHPCRLEGVLPTSLPRALWRVL